MPQDNLRVCNICGQHKPLASFKRTGDGSRQLLRAGYECYECRETKRIEQECGELWDWAAAVKKATIARTLACKGLDGIWQSDIDSMTIRCLLRLQNGTCAVLRRQFTLPPASLILPKHTGLDDWARAYALDDKKLGMLPILVRATTSSLWTPGSVVLIARCLEGLYRQAGSVAGIVDMLAHQQVPMIHAANLITIQRAEIVKEMMAVVRVQREREREERKEEARLRKTPPDPTEVP